MSAIAILVVLALVIVLIESLSGFSKGSSEGSETRPGKVRIGFGIVLVALQAFSNWGNSLSNTQMSPLSTGQLVYDVIVFLSSNFIGIVGLILLISGLVAYFKQ